MIETIERETLASFFNPDDSNVHEMNSFADNDPKHTSRVAKEYFNRRKIRVVVWPSMNPDLNPIENVWHRLKVRVQARNPPNVEVGWQYVLEEWEKIPKSYCQKLVYSMPKRLEEVLKRFGYKTKY